MHKHIVVSFLVVPLFHFFGIAGTDKSQANEMEKIQFNRDIRPILSQACFRCHGFDEKTREAGLRLDTRDGATKKLDGDRTPIAPGDLATSEVWARIITEDSDLAMPPKASNRQLSDSEKDLIKRWIEQGAGYENHWSFEPIPNKVNDLNIDFYLDQQLTAAGLNANPTADAISLIRRVAFTLTGLPPTLDQVERFSRNPTQDQYATLVDEFLSSPHFGEEMAKHWLDVARYGDTHGLHLDNERTMWAYRDWVIEAFNENLPYDQFTIEQIAGDLLPNPTQKQLVATGFNRCNVTTSEGGAINEEFLYRYAVDRTSTTVQAWLGLTGGCAVCHDHKYDPLTTKEFYSLYSFFYSAADPAMDGNIQNTQPFLKLASVEQKTKLEELRATESRLRKELLEIANDPVRRSDLQMGERISSNSLNPAVMVSRSDLWINDLMPLGVNARNTSRNEETWISAKDAPMGGRYIRQSFGDKFEQFISGGWIARDVPKDGTFSVWVRPDRYETPEAIYVMLKIENKSYRWVWANSLEQGRLLGANEKSIMGEIPKPGVWTQLTVSLKDLPATAVLQELQFGLFGGIADWDGFVCTGHHEQIANEKPWAIWWKKQSGKSLPLTDGELNKALKEGPDSEAGKEKESEIAAYFYAYISDETSAELLAKRTEWEETRVSLAAMESEIPGTFVFKDVGTPRQAHVMTRGQYDQKGEPVVPNTPAFLPPLSREDNARPTRLDLAKWIVAKNNPLTARVAVNRIWQQVFGVGLVKTSDDFGTQGTPPTHPELLDAMASEFMQTGWDVKRLIKKMILTRAFQRAAIANDNMLKIDPENRLLARGPRIRLDAEQIRDNVLASAGILNRKLGGSGFKGYQPPGIWEPVGYGDSNTRYYVQDHGAEIYRRSVYAFFKRTAPPPFMSNFDAPNREQFCSRRERSNTPLQALQLMNDIQYIEASRCLSENIIQKNLGSDRERIQVVMKQALSREATESEFEKIQSAYDAFRKRFQETPADAARLLRVGERPANPILDQGEVAALCLIINLVFNLDEFVNRN